MSFAVPALVLPVHSSRAEFDEFLAESPGPNVEPVREAPPTHGIKQREVEDEGVVLQEEREEFCQSELRKELKVATDVVEIPQPILKGLDIRPPLRIGPRDFELLSVIGMGAFGKVLQVRSRRNGQICAMKCISKKMLKKKNHAAYMKAERDIMARVDHPFIVGLKCAFQTDKKLFLVMEYLPGGELFYHLSKQGLLLEANAAFYSAEMVLALEHLHANGIVHRDLKPENLLLCADGHICLTDFGLAKELEQDEEDGLKTICGTNEYMAPEMILRRGYGKAVDWWSMGALAYEMMSGYPPFRGKDTKELNRKILNERVSMPKWLSQSAHQIIRAFLERDVAKRLGAARGTMFEVGGVTAVKKHPFFSSIDWAALLARRTAPPFLPTLVNGALDTSNFCEEFVAMQLPRSLSEDSAMSHCANSAHGGSKQPAAAPASATTAALTGIGAALAGADSADSAALAAAMAAAATDTKPLDGAASKECKYVAPNGMFRGFSFVADRFDLNTGSWLPLSEGEEGGESDRESGCKQLPSGFHIGPLVKLVSDDGGAAAGGEDATADAKRKVKGKRIRKKKKAADAAGADGTAAAGDDSSSRLDRQGSFGSFGIPPPEDEEGADLQLQSSSALAEAVMALGSSSKAAADSSADAKALGPPKRSSLALILQQQQEAAAAALHSDARRTSEQQESSSVWHAVSPPRPAKVPVPTAVSGLTAQRGSSNSSSSAAAAAQPPHARKTGWDVDSGTAAAPQQGSFSRTAAAAAATVAGRPLPAAGAAHVRAANIAVTGAGKAPQGPAPGSWAARIAAGKVAAAAPAQVYHQQQQQQVRQATAPIPINPPINRVPGADDFPALGMGGNRKKGGARGGAWGPKAY